MTDRTDELLVRALRAPTAVAVRRRLFRQTLASLVYEGALAVDVEGTTHVVAGADTDGRPVRYRFDAHRALGFDRVRADGPVVREDADGTVAEATSLPRFLGEIRGAILGGAYPDRLARFAVEVEETRIKDALAEDVRARRSGVLTDADHELLEGLITDGHRYHPAYKSRIGFDLDDDLAYGPEFLPAVHPFWVAAHRSVAEVTTSAAVRAEDLHDELGSTTRAAFDARIRGAGGEPGDYAWLPVHPWQWRERIGRAFADLLADGRLVALGPDPAAFSPQQSIRTLSCRDDPRRHHLKLALSITNTSTARGLAPHTVRNAAPISDWLARIVARDDYLTGGARVIVLGEVHGVSVAPAPPSDLVRADTEGALAAIWRTSLASRLEEGERAVPVTGLTTTEADGTPLIAPWIAAHGARTWVEALTDAVALPLVHLLVRHGVALESHAQNMSLVLRDGLPRRVALKDFHDGVRFCRRLLADPDDAPHLAPPPAHHPNRNSFVETDDPHQVTDFLLDAFFFVNLGELGLLLTERGLMDEAAFWGIVAARVRAHDRRYGTGTFDLFAATLEVEKLTTRRLTPDTELALHRVPNPLHRFDPDRRETQRSGARPEETA
ncbi:IucA/IucC family protein [Actinomycetospora aeridis]|uniref:IucA/IucC family protein n=1 Tax=Actinomycetospora aeridis TaxID=3129231 RepID=A0ABU8N5N7_9PSEU